MVAYKCCTSSIGPHCKHYTAEERNDWGTPYVLLNDDLDCAHCERYGQGHYTICRNY